MAESTPVIASAVVVPGPEKPPESSDVHFADASDLSLKRRASDGPEDAPKRRKVGNETAEDDESKQARRTTRHLEEKRRGQRLFGALLGTLSQGKTNAAQKRREDIEKRQREKLLAQSAEDDTRRRERLDQLRVIRKAEQMSYDEDTMRLRHENMRHCANVLTTQAEPRLYYKPRKFTREQEHQIDRQREDTEKAIAEELQEFSQRKREQANSPEREQANSPERERANSPERERANSPERERANNPERKQAHSPEREEANSPERGKANSPARERANSPEREQEGSEPTENVRVSQLRAEQAKPTGDHPILNDQASELHEGARHDDPSGNAVQHDTQQQRRAGTVDASGTEEEMKDADELDGELVVEAGEDTVIY